MVPKTMIWYTTMQPHAGLRHGLRQWIGRIGWAGRLVHWSFNERDSGLCRYEMLWLTHRKASPMDVRIELVEGVGVVMIDGQSWAIDGKLDVRGGVLEFVGTGKTLDVPSGIEVSMHACFDPPDKRQ